MADKRNKWFHDNITPDLVQLHSIKEILYSGQTKFQSVDIVQTGSYGLCLILDGKIQSSESDEFIYHESLVHPCMLAHPKPRSVFMAGAGEGAVLREVLAHKGVESVTMVDIDKEVVDICRKYLTTFHQNSFSDPRVKLVYTDARKYLENLKQKFDVIYMDLVDPMEGGPAYLLYTKEFYSFVKARLNPGGIICVQSGATTLTHNQSFTAIVKTLKSLFKNVSPYVTTIPAFVDPWGFTAASDELDPASLTAKEIDNRLKERVKKDLKFYDGITHESIFGLPKYLRRQIASNRRVITDDKPVYAY
jgi:spermidine synthase